VVALSIFDAVGALVFFCVTMALVLVSKRLGARVGGWVVLRIGKRTVRTRIDYAPTFSHPAPPTTDSLALAHQADESTITIHDYSIRVTRLPQDASAEELVEFFSQYGEVVHVELVRAYGTLLGLVMQQGTVMRSLKVGQQLARPGYALICFLPVKPTCTVMVTPTNQPSPPRFPGFQKPNPQQAVAQLQRQAEAAPSVPSGLEDKVEKTYTSLAALTDRIKAEQAQSDSRRTVAAFVTFREEAGKSACLKAQPHSRMRQWLFLKREHKLRGRCGRFGWLGPHTTLALANSCHPPKPNQAPKKPNQTESTAPSHPLNVQDAPEPTDVKFENIEHGVPSRAARRVLTSALQYLGLAVGFVLISMASAMRFNQAAIAGVDRRGCNAACDYKVRP
jgi:hypothetical protein